MPSEDWKYRRRRLQLALELREKGIGDSRVIAAIEKVPRHLFVDAALRSRAYRDEALPIGLGQTISQPFTVAYQTEMLGTLPGDKILEIGTGSGYQAAILAEMAVSVHSVERLQPLYERTRTLLRRLGYRVTMKCGDGTKGWPAFAPYDGIIVTAGAQEIPRALVAQLAEPKEDRRGGVLVIPVGGSHGQKMMRIVRTGPDSYEEMGTDDFLFVPLVEGPENNSR
jgi:protein-L-isoaspartate(D-aspartate) O-methyltransferase